MLLTLLVNGGIILDYRLIGSRIREYRVQQCITQEKLAEIIHVSSTYVGAVENARKRPSLTTLVKMANALGTTPDFFLIGNIWNDIPQCKNELNELLQDCSPYERQIIFALARAVKNTLRQSEGLLRIDYD